MISSRDSFLDRVRQAVNAGNQAGVSTDLAPRGGTGYQGADPDPVARFRDEFLAVGGTPHLVPDPPAALECVLRLVQARGARRVLLGRGPFLDTLELPKYLSALGLDWQGVETLSPDTGRDSLFAADIGISGVDYLIAETGTIVICSQPREPRSLSLLPPVHIAVAHQTQLTPDLFDVVGSSLPEAEGALPSCVSLITGPSKTGDIELKLVTGVHGPGEIHVVLMVV